MNKNLKKVISTIAALAISASSFVAFATATSFPDVEDTAAYSTAVKELVGLGIVNGYEDGTFGPDQLVTRAEITKMIVLALGMGSSADAAYGSDTQFSDVTGSHWASGYITVGVSQGFINGMGDGTFDPDANVQFLQAEKMLVGACGYTTWAENAGGWPSGYSSYANTLDLADSIEGSPSNTTELNRGQVAQLISNALDAPACVEDGYEYDAWGNAYPKLVQKNGTGSEYQTLLTKKHDAYKVYGRVTANSKSTAGALDSDEVNFKVEKADNFNELEYSSSANDPETITAKTGDSGAEDYLLEYSEAIIQDTDDDDWEIIVITSTSKNTVETYDADMFDDENSSYGDYLDADSLMGFNGMYFYNDSNKKKSTLKKLNGYNNGDQDDVIYYVNGVEEAITSDDDFNTFIRDNDNGTITLIDAPDEGKTSTDGYFDYVMVTFYADATVDSVSTSSTPKISFDEKDELLSSSLTVDYDDDVTYSFQLGLDGEEIDVTDIEEDDVLSIAFDVTVDFSDSSFYDVYVSRDVVSGKVTSIDSEDGYQISGTYYEPNTRVLSSLVEDGDYVTDADITSGTEYTLYLNVFGRFVSLEEGEGSVKNYMVLDSVYVQYNTDYYVSAYTQTGSKTNYKIRTSNNNLYKVAATVYDYDLSEYEVDGEIDWDAVAAAEDVDDIIDADRKHYSERVAEVSVNSSNELTLKEVASERSDYTGEVSDEYKLKSYKIGSVKLSDSTIILDFTDYYDNNGDIDGTVGTLSLSSFVDESDYTIYGYNKASSDSTYRFVLVGEGNSDISGASSLAVFSSSGTTTNSNDDDAIQIKAYVDGELAYLVVSTDLVDPVGDNDLYQGTPFFYTLDSDGYVDEIQPVFNSDVAYNLSDEADFFDTVFGLAEDDENGSFDSVLDSYFLDENGVSDNFGTSSTEAYMHFGPVTKKTSNTVEIGSLMYSDTYGVYTTNVDNSEDYSVVDGANVYVYDYAGRSSSKVSAETRSSIVSTSLSKSNYLDGSGKTYVDWTTLDPSLVDSKDAAVSYILVKEYDDDVTEALVITNSDR
ncbi:MAG: S-layer homology domain-containing protein [Firmicutes bacterium]|nr:S-layer homology domain-containing protein [Bacillota bacterium]